MTIGRRDFIKVLSAGTLLAAGAEKALARPPAELSPDAVGILYDATLCIGCKSCEVACKRINEMPDEHGTPLEIEHGVSGIWDSGNDLNSKTLNKIKVYSDGTGKNKDQVKDGYSFVKRACMHCIDPDCVSACPPSALQKEKKSGVVTWNEDACIGCRYCQIACPFNIPKFEFDNPFPKIVKCELCMHVQEKGGIPGCCEFCPTGASLSGNVSDLLVEAKRRMALKEGDEYQYPLHSLDSGEVQIRPAKDYVQHIYGEKETGGTQYLLLSGVPFEKLGLPDLPDFAMSAKSETMQHALYKGLIAPIALLGGFSYMAYKNTKDEGGDDE